MPRIGTTLKTSVIPVTRFIEFHTVCPFDVVVVMRVDCPVNGNVPTSAIPTGPFTRILLIVFPTPVMSSASRSAPGATNAMSGTRSPFASPGTGVGVTVAVDVDVVVGVIVDVGVTVGVSVGVGVSVDVGVTVGVSVKVEVGV